MNKILNYINKCFQIKDPFNDTNPIKFKIRAKDKDTFICCCIVEDITFKLILDIGLIDQAREISEEEFLTN